MLIATAPGLAAQLCTMPRVQPLPYAHEIQVALRAAREAGATALQMQGGITATDKADGSPVTQGDLAADEIVRHHLGLAFPNDAILSEERPDDQPRLDNRRLWIVDPIDGTKDYVAGANEWAVQVALAIDGKLVLGVVDLPGEGCCLLGVPGHGAFILDADGERPVSLIAGGDNVLITSQSRRNREAVGLIRAALPEFSEAQATSVGVKAWRVIQGRAGVYIHPRTIAEWDVAAPAALLAAAGGTATDFSGGTLRYNTPSGRCAGLVFSKRPDHAEIIARIQRSGVVLVP